jgi:transglutaminase-like putative cysteine protease
MPREREVVFVGILTVAAIGLGFAPRVFSQATTTTPSRSFTLTETIHIAPPAARGGNLRVWVPMPYEETSQGAGNAKVSGLDHWKMYTEPDFRNRYAYAEISEAELEHGAEVKATFHVQRFEHHAATEYETDVPGVPYSVSPRLLQPDHFVVMDGAVADLSLRTAGYAALQIDKARKVYEYVVSNTKYEPQADGLSTGETLNALYGKKGDSAEIAALFVGMARAAGVRARCETGYVLPTDARSGVLTEEHAWAQVYIAATGWVPVDAAAAIENKSERDFYFGTVDANRVEISAGRDIRLDPRQASGPLNYFVKAYAELDGKPYDGITTEFSFKDDVGAGPATVTASTK